jgi:uncharacterized protein
MGKVIFWIVIVIAVLFVLRMINVAKLRRQRGDTGAPPADPAPKELMVRCVECGVFLPRAEAEAGPKGLRCGDVQCKQRAEAKR